MKNDIKTFLERARNHYNRMQLDIKKNMKVSLETADCIYNLRRIKISVAYRRTDQNFTEEEKKMIEEIRQLCFDAEELWRELNNKKISQSKLGS